MESGKLSAKAFTTNPKTRRHTGSGCISRDRAMAFMEYLFERGFRGRLSYEALRLQFVLFFGTNDSRTVERYIGRPERVERYGGDAKVVRLNRMSGKVAHFEYFNERRLREKKGLMEILGYISILKDGTVILHHEGMPYYTSQVSLDETLNYEHRIDLQELRNEEG